MLGIYNFAGCLQSYTILPKFSSRFYTTWQKFLLKKVTHYIMSLYGSCKISSFLRRELLCRQHRTVVERPPHNQEYPIIMGLNWYHLQPSEVPFFTKLFYKCLQESLDNSPPSLCVEMGFAWILSGNQDATLK